MVWIAFQSETAWRYDDAHPGRVLPNLDDGPTEDVLLELGWEEVDPPMEALFDLWLDPAEAPPHPHSPSAGAPRPRLTR